MKMVRRWPCLAGPRAFSSTYATISGKRRKMSHQTERAFSIVGPYVWNGLPSDLRSLPRDLSSSFYKILKTLLFVGPGLGAPLSIYLERALYKLLYIYR